jgi:hypothetical protein
LHFKGAHYFSPEKAIREVIKMPEDKAQNKIPTSLDSFRFAPQQLPRPEPKADEPQTVTFGWHSSPQQPLYMPSTKPEDMIRRQTLQKREG